MARVRMMPLDQGDLADIGGTVHLDDAAFDAKPSLQRPGRRLVLDDADDTRFHLTRPLRGRNVEILGPEFALEPHRAARTCGITMGGNVGREPAVLCQ